jgi:hypothetical protein
MVFRLVAEPLDAGWLCAALEPAAAGVVEDELLLPQPATSATSAVAPAAPSPNFPIPNADIRILPEIATRVAL